MAPLDDAQSAPDHPQPPLALADPQMLAPWSPDAHSTPSLDVPPPAPARVLSLTAVASQPVAPAAETQLGAPSPRYALPSNPASKRRADDSASSSPTKRSRTSRNSTSTTFGSGVKTKLEDMYGSKCWHCRAPRLLEMAHMFAKADSTFAQCQQLGLVDLPSRGQAENALLLCPSCHAALDKDNVLLIVVPYDLQYFIDMERSWQRNFREHKRARPNLMDVYTLHCMRNFPTEHAQCSAEYESSVAGGLYSCYMLEDFFPVYDASLPRPSLQRTRIWHGDPKAAIRRALKQILSTPFVPPHLANVKKLLVKLDGMYDEGNALLYSSSLPQPNVHRDSDNDPPHFSGPPVPGPPVSGPFIQGAFVAPSNADHTNPAHRHRQYSSSHGHHQRLLATDSPTPKHSTELATPAVSRKRKRGDSPRLPTPSSTEGKTEEQEETPSKNSKKRRKHTSPSPGAAVHAEGPTQRARLWQWGGPNATTAENIHYYRDIFGVD